MFFAQSAPDHFIDISVRYDKMLSVAEELDMLTSERDTKFKDESIPQQYFLCFSILHLAHLPFLSRFLFSACMRECSE